MKSVAGNSEARLSVHTGVCALEHVVWLTKQVAPWIAPMEFPARRECRLPTRRAMVQ